MLVAYANLKHITADKKRAGRFRTQQLQEVIRRNREAAIRHLDHHRADRIAAVEGTERMRQEDRNIGRRHVDDD